MYGCESWTIKKVGHQRIDAFELWCWRRLLRVPWTARRSNQSILKEISPEYSLGGLMLKLKLQYFGQLGKNWLIGKDPDAGKDWRQEEKGMTEDEMVGLHHWLNGHEFEHGFGVFEGHGSLVCCSPWGCRVGHNWVTGLKCLLISWLQSLSSVILEPKKFKSSTISIFSSSICHEVIYEESYVSNWKNEWKSLSWKA